MRLGSPIGAGLGDPHNAVAYLRSEIVNGGCSANVWLRAAPGRGDASFILFANSRAVAIVNAPENAESDVITVPLNPDDTTIHWLALRIGKVALPGGDYSRVARTFEAAIADSITARWNWQADIIGASGESGYTSNWNLSGLKVSNTEPVTVRRTWSKLQLYITVSGGIATVELYNATTLVASGSASVAALPGAVALSQQNGSGINGSVTLAATVASVSGASLYLRWPASMQVLRSNTNPPADVRATVPFNGQDSGSYTERGIPTGTWYCAIRPLSDTGVAGTLGVAEAKTIAGVPDAPTDLHYDSGDATLTRIAWTESLTPGVTYRVFAAQEDGAPIDLNNPVSSTANAYADVGPLAAGKTTLFLVRAELAGVMEDNGQYLRVEYDGGGAYVPPRPNAPALDAGTVVVSGGTTLAVLASYDAAGEEGTASGVQLFARTKTGAYNFAAPIGTAVLTDLGGGLKSATIPAVLATGQYFLCACATTDAGAVSAPSAEIEIATDSEVLPAVPAEFDVSGG